jgi:hypothetical protein
MPNIVLNFAFLLNASKAQNFLDISKGLSVNFPTSLKKFLFIQIPFKVQLEKVSYIFLG